MPAAPDAIPPNPKIPAMIAKMKNVSAQESIVLLRMSVKCSNTAGMARPRGRKTPIRLVRLKTYAIAVPRKRNRFSLAFFLIFDRLSVTPRLKGSQGIGSRYYRSGMAPPV